MLQKHIQVLPGSGPCPKDEQFLPVQQPGLALWLQGTVLLTWAWLQAWLGVGLHPWTRWLLIFRHRLLKCGAPGGRDPFPQLQVSLAAPLQQARHSQGTGKVNITGALTEGAAEGSLLVLIQKPKTRTLCPSYLWKQ